MSTLILSDLISARSPARICCADRSCVRRCCGRPKASIESCCSATCSSCATGRRARRSPRRARSSRISVRRSRGEEIVVLAGNHDHAMIEPWLARRGRTRAARAAPARAAADAVRGLADGRALCRLGRSRPCQRRLPRHLAAPGRLCDARPLSRLPSDGADDRAAERRPDGRACSGVRPTTFEQVEDYESVTAPMFAWRDAVARTRAPATR